MRLSMHLHVRVCGVDDPGRPVRDTEIHDSTSFDGNVQRVHDLLDRGCPVPPVHVVNVDVISLQFGERSL
jgi:hypothetical protein